MKNKGITLVALIITIIVLIIIAGVSITAAVNKNGILDSADKAYYKNSISQIEEEINKFYNENYIEVEDENIGNFKEDTPITKARALAYYFDSKGESDNIFRPALPGGQNYTYHKFNDDKFAYVSSEGLVFYMLSPKNLKKFDSTLSVLDLDEPDLRNGSDDIDNIYGVTADLRVFIIKEDIDHLIGITKEELSAYDLNSVVYKSGSDWAKALGEEKDVTYQDGQSKKSLELNFNSIPVSDDFDFSGIGELKHLTSLNISNCKLKSIKGIEESQETLKYLFINTCEIEDWSGIDKLTNLETLIIQNVSQDQLDKILSKMSKSKYTKLSKLGVIGNGAWGDYCQGVTDERYFTTKNKSITNINGFSNFKSETKKAVKTLFLTGNSITSLEPLSGFTNLVEMRADSNNIESFKGLEDKTNLVTLRMANNNLTSFDGFLNSQNNINNPKLNWIDVRKNTGITNISAVKKITSLKKLWFMSELSLNRSDSDNNIPIEQITEDEETRKFLISLNTNLLIDPKYSQYLVDNSSTNKLVLVNKIDKNIFKSYSQCKSLEKLSINGITIVDEKGNDIGESETNKLINEILKSSNLKSIKYLQIVNMGNKMTSAGFLSNLTNLVELDFRNNSATDLDGLQSTPIKKLSINNTGITLSTPAMQNVISKLSNNRSHGFWTVGSGLLLCNNELYNQLKDCTEITNLYLDRDWRSGAIATTNEGNTVDLSNCKKLTNFYSYNISAKYILPESLVTAQIAQSNANGGFDFSRCKKLTTINVSDNITFSNLEKSLKTIPSGNSVTSLRIYGMTTSNSDYTYSFLSSCNLDKLKSLEISDWDNRPQSLNSFSGIAELSSLETIIVSYAPNLQTLCDLSKLKKLKSLEITNSGLEVIPDVGLQNLEDLQTLKLDNNRLTNLYGLLVKDDKKDFKNLKSLSLKNNTLEDRFTMNVITYNIEDKVFIPLYNRGLRKLYLSGNSFSNLSKIANLKWEDKNGF